MALKPKILTRHLTAVAYPFSWDCIALAMSVRDALIPVTVSTNP
jgi:hypothetical protein